MNKQKRKARAREKAKRNETRRRKRKGTITPSGESWRVRSYRQRFRGAVGPAAAITTERPETMSKAELSELHDVVHEVAEKVQE